MPAQTYEQHKTAIDAAYPTPPVTWRLYGDDPSHKHDDKSIAYCDVEFGGERIYREVELEGFGLESYIGITEVPVRLGQRGGQYTSGTTWELAKAAFAPLWERICEDRRKALATEAWVRDQLVNDGVTYGVVKLTTLSVGGPSQAVVPLSPEFDADTLAYTATTSFANVVMLALASEGATVSWTVGEASVEGGIASVDLDAGANVITITVSRSEYTSTVYTLTITRR